MATELSVKGVPEEWMDALRKRARRNNRSLESEVMALLESAVAAEPLTVEEAEEHLESLNFQTPGEAVAIIREDRDAR